MLHMYMSHWVDYAYFRSHNSHHFMYSEKTGSCIFNRGGSGIWNII